jgi:hypothetical protein
VACGFQFCEGGSPPGAPVRSLTVAGQGHGRLAASRPWRYHAGVAAVPYSQVPRSAWEGTETVYFPHSDLDGEILNAIHQAVPDGATYGVNHDFRRAWVRVSRPGNTREVLRGAFASLGRELPGDPDDG